MTNSPTLEKAPYQIVEPEAAGGIPWMVGTKILLLGVYFAISVITVRGLGADSYGVFSLCRNIAEYLVVICALGMNAALLRFIPELVMQRNRAGLRRLLWKAAALQGGMVVLATLALYAATPLFDRSFKTAFGFALVLTGLVVGGQIAKDYLNDTFTALFRMRTVTVLSAGQALLWAGLLAAGMAWRPSVSVALLAQWVSMTVAAIVAAWLLVRCLRRLDWRSPPQGIGRRRTLSLALPTMLNTSLRMLMMKYTEVFFLGAFFTPAVVGIYDLGYSTPQVVMSLIPAALQTLFTATFARAYSHDPDCLPRLIRAVYKMLLLVLVPLAAFGCVFSPRAIVLLYGEAMSAAGPIASAFCVLNLLPLVSIPLSMAIVAREKVLKMLPYMILQVLVNLLLDYLLIRRWGCAGAVAAVALTFILTIPWRLRAVRQILGTIPFPTGFLIRIALASALAAGALSFTAPWLNLPLLAVAVAVYGVLWLGLVRAARLIRPDDLEDLRLFGTPAMNRAAGWLAGMK